MSRRVDVAAWIGREEYERAGPFVRRAYVDLCAALLREAKRRQIESGIGADGRPLRRVKPTSRPDGTTDRPLTPHDEASRTLRLLKLTPNPKTGIVTYHWNSWTRILGFHATGTTDREGREVLPVRDVFGTPGRFLRRPREDARRWWAQHGPIRPSPTASPRPEIAARAAR